MHQLIGSTLVLAMVSATAAPATFSPTESAAIYRAAGFKM